MHEEFGLQLNIVETTSQVVYGVGVFVNSTSRASLRGVPCAKTRA
jgi:hypothetical protein